MDNLLSALNVNGNQNIAKLRMSVDQTEAPNGHYREEALSASTESGDSRIRSQESTSHDSQTDTDNPTTFDMDFFPTDTGEQGHGRRSFKEVHVFGQAEAYRVGEGAATDSKASIEEDKGYERARRRAAGLTLVQKLVLNFSLLVLYCIFQRPSPVSGFLFLRCCRSRFSAYLLHLQDHHTLAVPPARQLSPHLHTNQQHIVGHQHITLNRFDGRS